jgi:uncharacterized protein YjbJ (UPF0337 family)
LTNASIEMPLLEIPLERTSFRSVLIRSKARRFTPDPSGARVHDVSIPRFPRILFASGMPAGWHVFLSSLIVDLRAAGRTSPTMRSLFPCRSRYERACATCLLEQYVTEAVILHISKTNNEDMAMDKDRIKGSAEQAKGTAKEAAGKVFGDKKLETEGKTDKAAGKVQNAIGGLKDAVRGK